MIRRLLALELQNVCNARAVGFFTAHLFATLPAVLHSAVSIESVNVLERSLMITTERQHDDLPASPASSLPTAHGEAGEGQLIRGVGLASATTLNMIDMIG